MSDETALRKDAERAARAQALLDDEMLAEAFDGLERAYFEAWKDPGVVAPADVDGRERLWQAAQIVGKVRTHLKEIASRGTLAHAELQRLAQGAKS